MSETYDKGMAKVQQSRADLGGIIPPFHSLLWRVILQFLT